MILSHIVAAAKNGAIGSNGALPWRIPEDTKFFKEKTLGHVVIMGRKTFETLPSALGNRLNIVVTRDPDYKCKGAIVVSTMEKAVAIAREHRSTYGNEVFIAGGGEIYRQTLDLVDRVYLTLIHQDFDGDAFYPVNELKDFHEVKRDDRTEPVPFSFLILERK
ncbi:MAG: dihydrofolate reductase [Bdellovibrionia bacterium]